MKDTISYIAACIALTWGMFAPAFLLAGCTAAQGKLTGQILAGVCDAGTIILAIPNAEPICADIVIVEQIIANWNAPSNAMHASRPITQADLYAMVKATGHYKAAH